MIEKYARHIYATLGAGYSERIYHNAMEVLLRKHSVPYESERVVPVEFEGHVIGNLRADIIVDRRVVLEFKSIAKIGDKDEQQARNYLRLLNLDEAMLINFGKNFEIRRVLLGEEMSTSCTGNTGPCAYNSP
jgi:GxxExxY protein